MSVTATTLTATSATTSPASSLRRSTLVTGLKAAAVTTAAAAAADAAGVSFEIEGEVIPLVGFAQMVLIGAVLGGLILAGLNRWSTSAHQRFIQVTVALTALSCIPSVVWPDETSTKITLVALHVVAAAIIVPVLARHARS